MPKRQETLGPTSPIQDWEVERATILLELNNSREKVKRFENQIEIDRQTYEKNTSSLLREVKLKESFIKDIEEQLMAQILELQNTLDSEKIAHQEEIQKLKIQHQLELEAEDKKYQRRLASFQERLTAKDKEYNEIMERQLTLPNNDNKESLIESLKVELAQEKAKHTLPSFDENKLASLKVQHAQQIEALLQDAQIYKKRLQQTISGHDTHIRELTEKFMSEIQQSHMSNHAQLQNLQSEHTEVVRELKEQYDTEKEVWHIQQTSLIKALRRDLLFEKQESIRQLTKEWKEKNENLLASMSKDAQETQSHWETKLKEANSQNDAKYSRLQGEIQVVKDRLGKEIQRRKLNQSSLLETTQQLENLEIKWEKLQSDHTRLLRKFTVIKNQNKTSHRLALDIITTISPQFKQDKQTTLQEILHATLRKVSILSIENSHQDTLYTFL